MELGKKLYIRSLVNVASEPITYYWPMRTFITRNPLRELEDLPFREAIKEGELLFGGRGYLRREDYRHLYSMGHIKEEFLRESIKEFLSSLELSESLPYEELVFALLTQKITEPAYNLLHRGKAKEEILEALSECFTEDPSEVCRELFLSIGVKNTLQDLIKLLTGKDPGRLIDELVIKTAFDFLDEGQSTIDMPGRDAGLYRAWRELAKRNLRFLLWTGRSLVSMLKDLEEPEEAIEYVLTSYELPQPAWEGYITLELAKLKGIAGFIKWRSHNKYYYWQKVHPVDMVDYAAIRLLVAKSVLDASSKDLPFRPTYRGIEEFLSKEKEKAYLMYEFSSRNCPPQVAEDYKKYLKNPAKHLQEYITLKAQIKAKSYYRFLSDWLKAVDLRLEDLSAQEVLELLRLYHLLKEEEGYVWLRAFEETHIQKLVESIKLPEKTQEKPLAQALFCIDVRSERFRRKLESVGNYQTFGVAGFFGIPVAMVDLRKGHEEFLCPVIVTPKNVVFEMPYSRKGIEKDKALSQLLHGVKDHILAPFVAVEMLGFAFGFDFIGKTFLPDTYAKAKDLMWKESVKTSMMVNKLSEKEIEDITTYYYTSLIKKALEEMGIKDADPYLLFQTCLEEEVSLPEELRSVVEVLRSKYRVERGFVKLFEERLRSLGFTKEEQAFLVSTTLKSIGLVKDFAPIVFVLGHESRSENNPYESALDCGACGGASGIYNARIFCTMANNPAVRQIMKQKHGLNIPEETVFLPGIHNTTTDQIVLYDLEYLPAIYVPMLERIRRDFEEARRLTAQERAGALDAGSPEQVYRKAYDWSEVRPEWGLSGNYAFVIGRRYITKLSELEGRVFLHSYDYTVDPKGFLLENILAGPAVVGQWINMEYYFSTTDNEVYGSGSKVYHNVVGRIGVMTGNYSDLRTGLPAQTVLKEGKPFHVPVRYTLVIEAPLELSQRAISRIRKIRDLMQNEWINALVFDPQKGVFYRYLKGSWVEYQKKQEVKV